jgi:hypothetical protein
MSETEKIISDGVHHLRLVSTERSYEDAAKLCEQLNDLGYMPATQVITDTQIEVYQRFLPMEEIEYYYETKVCGSCQPKAKAVCSAASCKHKQVLENCKWHEQMGWHGLLVSRYELLLAGALP